MDGWTLTWTQVAPLYQDSWQGPEAALRVLGDPQVFALLMRLSTFAWTGRRDCRARFTEPTDLACEVIAMCARRLADAQGMKRPPAWQARPTPEGTLVNYLESRIRDACRQRVGERIPPRSLDERGEEDDRALGERLADTARPPADEELAARREQRRLRRTLGQAEALTEPQHLLAWLCLNLPEQVEPRHVERAEASLARSREDTWTLLHPWLEAVVEPQAPAERRFLAWTLRTRDDTDPSAWAATDPAGAKTARDTVSQWARRARIELGKHIVQARGTP